MFGSLTIFTQSADLSVPGEEEPITGIEDMLRVSSITQAGEESQRMGAVVCIWGNEVMAAGRVQRVKNNTESTAMIKRDSIVFAFCNDAGSRLVCVMLHLISPFNICKLEHS